MNDTPTTAAQQSEISNAIEPEPVMRSAPSELRSTTNTNMSTHDLISMLERDVKIGTLLYTQASATVSLAVSNSNEKVPMAKYDFPAAIFQNSPIVRTKLQHFQLFKADIVLTIRVNANQFQAGALLPVYTPYFNQLEPMRKGGSQYLASLTSNFSDVLSLEEGGTLEMVLPFANVHEYFNLGDTTQQFGTVQIWALCPLRSMINPDKVAVTVFARFKNPQPLVATSTNTMTVLQRAMTLNALSNEEEEAIAARVNARKVHSKTKESKQEGDVQGPVGKIAGVVGSVAESISSIPAVSHIAAPVGWVARAIGAVADFFGFSKDTNNNSVQYVNPIFGRFMENVDGQDNSRMLAMIADNKIDSSKLVIESKDEMAFEYIKRRLAYIIRFNFSGAAVSGEGKFLFAWPVHPLYGAVENNGANPPLTMHASSFQFVSSQFRYWNGSLSYVITIIKTKLVTGRLVAIYMPDDAVSAPATLGDLMNTNHHLIIDMNPKDGQQVIHVPFTIPYQREKPWLLMDPQWLYNKPPGASRPETNGKIVFYILNSLVAPETVYPGLDLLVGVRGGDDFSVALPGITWVPAISFASEEPEEPRKRKTGVHHKQAEVLESRDLPDVDFVPQTRAMGMEEKYTIGEKFLSLRALIKRFDHDFSWATVNESHLLSANDFGVYTSGNRTISRHTCTNIMSGVQANTTLSTRSFSALPTTLFWTSCIYRFWSGSTRIKVFGDAQARVKYGLVAHIHTNGSALTNNTITPEALMTPSGIHSFFHNPCLEVTIPYYGSQTAQVAGLTGNELQSTGGLWVSPSPDCNVTGLTISNGVTEYTAAVNRSARDGPQRTYHMYTAAGDDFSFWFLVGPPPCRRASELFQGLTMSQFDYLYGFGGYKT